MGCENTKDFIDACEDMAAIIEKAADDMVMVLKKEGLISKRYKGKFRTSNSTFKLNKKAEGELHYLSILISMIRTKPGGGRGWNGRRHKLSEFLFFELKGSRVVAEVFKFSRNQKLSSKDIKEIKNKTLKISKPLQDKFDKQIKKRNDRWRKKVKSAGIKFDESVELDIMKEFNYLDMIEHAKESRDDLIFQREVVFDAEQEMLSDICSCSETNKTNAWNALLYGYGVINASAKYFSERVSKIWDRNNKVKIRDTQQMDGVGAGWGGPGGNSPYMSYAGYTGQITGAGVTFSGTLPQKNHPAKITNVSIQIEGAIYDANGELVHRQILDIRRLEDLGKFPPLPPEEPSPYDLCVQNCEEEEGTPPPTGEPTDSPTVPTGGGEDSDGAITLPHTTSGDEEDVERGATKSWCEQKCKKETEGGEPGEEPCISGTAAKFIEFCGEEELANWWYGEDYHCPEFDSWYEEWERIYEECGDIAASAYFEGRWYDCPDEG